MIQPSAVSKASLGAEYGAALPMRRGSSPSAR